MARERKKDEWKKREWEMVRVEDRGRGRKMIRRKE